MIIKISILFLIINFSLFFFKEYLIRLYGVYDIPNSERKIHKIETSLIGGFIFYFNFVIFFIFSFINLDLIESVLIIFKNKFNYIFFFVVSTIFFLIGYFDDKKDINANFKLFLITATLLILLFIDQSLRVEIITFSFSDKIFYLNNYKFIFTLFCFLAFINAYNLFDGINLQVGIYTTYILLILYYLSGNILVFSFIFPTIIFLYLNSSGKIFLGNSGTYFLGFIISYLFINFFNNYQNISSDGILAVMLIPGLDMIRLFIIRIYQKKSPFSADKNHLHHKLLDIFGYKKTILINTLVIIIPLFLHIILNNKLSIIYSTIIYFLLLAVLNNLAKQIK